MDNALLTSLIGVFTGAVGYIFATFHVRPVIRYVDLRQQIISDLVFYADVNTASKPFDDVLRKRLEERIDSNRRHSANLAALIEELPLWYRCYLHCIRRHRLVDARHALIGLSNSLEGTNSRDFVAKVRSALRISTEGV